MFICEIWLLVRYFPQFCTSDMSKYGYLEVFQRVPFYLEIMRVDCSFLKENSLHMLLIKIYVRLFFVDTPEKQLFKVFIKRKPNITKADIKALSRDFEVLKHLQTLL